MLRNPKGKQGNSTYVSLADLFPKMARSITAVSSHLIELQTPADDVRIAPAPIPSIESKQEASQSVVSPLSGPVISLELQDLSKPMQETQGYYSFPRRRSDSPEPRTDLYRDDQKAANTRKHRK
jgi:hypothetical protein